MRRSKKSIRRRTANQAPITGAPKWMVTFSDLVTLILVFFILLYSMSQVDILKFQALAESFRGTGLLPENNSVQDGPAGGQDTADEPLNDLLQEVNQYLEKNGLTDVVVANRTERGVVLVLQEQALFESGQAELTSESNSFLNKVGELLVEMPNLVKVEGHTDNRPITTSQFPSNWELSAARAGSVIRYLLDRYELDPTRFVAVGYGETRPIASNDNSASRQQNRRVEIVIADPAYNAGAQNPLQ